MLIMTIFHLTLNSVDHDIMLEKVIYFIWKSSWNVDF